MADLPRGPTTSPLTTESIALAELSLLSLADLRWIRAADRMWITYGGRQ